jgi:hypothetical protein
MNGIEGIVTRLRKVHRPPLFFITLSPHLTAPIFTHSSRNYVLHCAINSMRETFNSMLRIATWVNCKAVANELISQLDYIDMQPNNRY